VANPFKFGSVVDGAYFTDRELETTEITGVLDSGNHLILISPRRFGKTSLAKRVTSALNRPVIYLDLQLVTDATDFAAQMLKRLLKINRWESIRHALADFRIVPTVELSPASGNMEVSFHPSFSTSFTPLEDVLALIEKTGSKGGRPIVILDEFQEVKGLGADFPKQIRAVIQHHKNINYVFLGSAESMMRRIFETKKSPFYHFGHLMTLGRIPHDAFLAYLSSGMSKVTDDGKQLAVEILAFTECHPYYTQQLAFYCYVYLERESYDSQALGKVVDGIVQTHDNDYERLWNTIKNTDKRILITLASGETVSTIRQPSSTVYSGMKRLTSAGYLIKNGTYGIDDPFFKKWIIERRS
jgi:AAA+ ATPase superfamily predicted ATPase